MNKLFNVIININKEMLKVLFIKSLKMIDKVHKREEKNKIFVNKSKIEIEKVE